MDGDVSVRLKLLMAGIPAGCMRRLEEWTAQEQTGHCKADADIPDSMMMAVDKKHLHQREQIDDKSSYYYY